ncbi:glycosyltransferase family 4 protein [Haloplanus natans]|uniref:glycosyltransferase family 4 protein n=1 Tax=Haloplanus natans TaxID=376171 RepID=UPI00146FAF71|nr:glycosyltransferase family 4 protein [Haloplanus natans]
MSSAKVCFIHNKVMDYRLPLFKNLNKEIDVDFLIFDQDNIDNLDATAVNKITLLGKIAFSNYDVIVCPDFIFTESLFTSILAKIKESTVVLYTEVWDMPNASIMETIHKKTVLNIIDEFVDAYVVPGKKSKHYIQRETNCEKNDVFMTRSACNINSAKPSDSSLDKFTICYVGRLIPLKRIQDVLYSAEKSQYADDIIIKIAGTGSEEYLEYLKEIAAEITPDTEFLGWVDDVTGVYDSSDVCILPSERDSFPLTVIESMKRSTPVVVSDGVGEANDLVINGYNGFVNSVGDQEGIAEVIDLLIERPSCRNKLAENAYSTINSEVSYNQMVGKFIEAIEYATK